MSGPGLVAPLFYFTDDVVSFDSLEALLAYVEPWDVLPTDRGFDAEGRRVALSGGDVVRRRFSVGGGQTALEVDQSGQLAAGEFEALLMSYIRSDAGVDLDEPANWKLPLDALVAAVNQRTSQR